MTIFNRNEINQSRFHSFHSIDVGSYFFLTSFLLVFGACLYVGIITYGFAWLEKIQPGAGALAFGAVLQNQLPSNFWAFFVLKIVLITILIADMMVGLRLAMLIWKLKAKGLDSDRSQIDDKR